MEDFNNELKKLALLLKSQNKIDKFIELAASHNVYVQRSSNTEGIKIK